MNDPLELASVRHQLALLARRRRAQTFGFAADWHPREVLNPFDGQPFTPTGAWEFIADKLEEGHPIEVVSLENPPGKTAYVMKIPMGSRVLYIKVQLGAGRIIGRSFHYSHPDRRTSEP